MSCCALQAQEINIDLFSVVLGQLSVCFLFFFAFILGMFCEVILSHMKVHMKVFETIGESIDVVLQHKVYNLMLST